MMNTKLDQALENNRSEEVQHIVERMPTRFGFWISMIVLFLFVLMNVFGWIVRYPDVVNGQISVNAQSAPLKLLANSYGKLKLTEVKSLSDVKEGQLIAYLENSTTPDQVDFIDRLIRPYNPNSDEIINLYHNLPKNFSLGELNIKFYAFSSALQQFVNFKQDHQYDKQYKKLTEILHEQEKAISSAKQRIEMAANTLNYAHKFYSRDSVLFAKRVISEAEFDKTQMNYISAKDSRQNALNNLINAKQLVQQTENKLQDISIAKPEKEKELQISLISAYNDLIDNIKSWRLKYVLKAPFDGKVQFLKYYKENEFVQNGEEVFTLIPKQDMVQGQVIVALQGAGKIEEGQEVIVKLDNFPYTEYGSVSGRVRSISLTTSTTKTDKAEIETYQVTVDFPNQMKTNYGTTLAFKAGAKGTAEIITKDRKLIERLFDNLKYVISK